MILCIQCPAHCSQALTSTNSMLTFTSWISLTLFSFFTSKTGLSFWRKIPKFTGHRVLESPLLSRVVQELLVVCLCFRKSNRSRWICRIGWNVNELSWLFLRLPIRRTLQLSITSYLANHWPVSVRLEDWLSWIWTRSKLYKITFILSWK